MRVIVAGMGIGGAAAALALEKLGVDHLVLEQAPELGEVGAGLQLSPNAVRVLERLDLVRPLKSFCVEPEAHVFADGLTSGHLLRTPLMPKVRDTFGAAYYHAHRADLLDALTGSVRQARYRLGARIVDVSQIAGAVTLKLADGRVETCDALIAADGIHSTVREQIFKPDRPRDTGCVAWRGLVPTEDARKLGFNRSSHVWMGPERSVVMYYVRGEELFNWVGIGPFNANAEESWSAKGSTEAALAEYDGWHRRILDLIACTDSLFMTSLYDREPLDRWVDGRIALMGDAAHAMMPFHAQGAGQSIEDAWVLARVLQESAGDVPGALKKYQDLRLNRANLVQQQSRNAEHLFHMSAPEDMARRNDRFRRLEEEARDGFPSGQRWLFAYDAELAVTGKDDDWRAMTW